MMKPRQLPQAFPRPWALGIEAMNEITRHLAVIKCFFHKSPVFADKYTQSVAHSLHFQTERRTFAA